MPHDGESGAIVPGLNASHPTHLSQMERFAFGSAQFADMGAPQLVAALRAAERGELRDWANLGDYILSGPDGWLAGKFQARAMRVAQADFAIVPGDKDVNSVALAHLCCKAFKRIPKLTQLFMRMLDAIPMGACHHHMRWGKFGNVYLPTEIEWVHLRRFRYDHQWQPRLWDQGQQPSEDGYGMPLVSEPGAWLSHYHETRGCYPGLYGELRKCTKLWLFMNWCQLWWIQNSEKYGSAFIWAKIPKDMKPEARLKLKQQLQAIASDHIGYLEEGCELHVEVAQAASRAFENFSEFLAFAQRTLTEQVLGTADASSPGDAGSNAAVETRMGAMTDPIMILDGAALADTIRDQLFRWVLHFNRHLMPDPTIEPVLPELRFFTADDEVSTDATDKAQENAAARGAVGNASAQSAQPSPASNPSAADQPSTDAPVADVAKEAFNGAQISSALEIVSKVAAMELLRSQAVSMLQTFFPSLSPAAAAAMVGNVGTDDPTQIIIPGVTPSPAPAADQPAPVAASREVAAPAGHPLAAALRARKRPT